jgi:hypothetical protein
VDDRIELDLPHDLIVGIDHEQYPLVLAPEPVLPKLPTKDRFRLYPERKERPSILEVIQLGVQIVEVALSDGAQS